ncbi:MAG: LysM peptidoglycan-binding domain-containing protein [Deltaproteobacteria bacterium]|nr:LysM peptidoglycan-binding domain-containing protein [Deltaproteobacteria bacterium]
MRVPNLVLAGAVLVALVPASSGAVQTYKVKKGDTLYEVAHRFHLGVDVLKGANALDGDGLRPGQKLKIPSKKSEAIEVSKREKKGNGTKHAADTVETAKKGKSDEARRTTEPVATAGTVDRASPRVHVVKKGDTLQAIARAHGVSVKELKALNGLKKRTKIKPGMELVVTKGTAPGKHGKGLREEVYVVKKGDNLWRVSKRFHLSARELKSLNQLHSEALKAGQKLVVARHSVPVPAEASQPSVTECRLDDMKVDAELRAASEEIDLGADPESTGITARVIRVAKKMLGIPYRFGGNSARGIDCSAYVQKVFRFLNMPLPRTAREQYEVGSEVERGELATGDLVFFRTYARYPSHVGIYLGDNQFIHASSKGKSVTIDSLDEPFYSKRFIGAKRVVVDETPETPKPQDKVPETSQSAG